MLQNKNTIIIFTVIVFLAGLYFYAKNNSKEGLENKIDTKRCPNILVQKGKRLYLYNTKIAKVPGVNPIEFENLEDYVEFMDWQRSQKIRCPVLFLQHSYDAQGNSGYKIRPGATNLHGGLPPTSTTTVNNSNSSLLVDATHDDPPYNTNSVPGFDASSYYIGKTTPLDKMNETQEHLLHSANAMDRNWGGEDYTKSMIEKGVYKSDEVLVKNKQ